MNQDTQERTLLLLQKLPHQGLDVAKELIWTELNYPRVNQELSTRSWKPRASELLEGNPVLLAQHKREGTSFDVIFIKLAEEQKGKSFPLSISAERQVINQLLQNHPLALFIFSNPEEKYWHFVNVKQEYETKDESTKKRTLQRVVRRISVGPEERLRTAAERLALLDLADIPKDLFHISPLEVQSHHDQAFDVQKVTEGFFQKYQMLFNEFQDNLKEQTEDTEWAHDYALQFLNRVMFLYFVQRKRWLNDDPEFMDSFWEAYIARNRPVDSYVVQWLYVLFFEAFNNQFQAGKSEQNYFPEDIKTTLSKAPFLNGGLFKKNELDTRYLVTIPDTQFLRILNFFKQYNFTISEDTPLDQEVAVDPEMIGKVYESLVNVSEETDEKGDAGIFYTPRVEIDLMCRLSMVDLLANHLGEEHRAALYELVFAFEPKEKEDANQKVAQLGLWEQLNTLLKSMKAVDPACGSGSFLIGMLYVINDLSERAGKQLGFTENPYERKKRLIGDCLYGVDVMEWAVHVAELRLWLQLVIETEVDIKELQTEPLLPELSFNVRHGDSLVQEIGGINLSLLRKKAGVVPSLIKKRITGLVKEKRKFYHNDRTCKYENKKQLQQEELNIFRDILDDRIIKYDKRLNEIDIALQPKEDMFGDQQTGQSREDEKSFQKDRVRIQEELIQLREARNTLKDVKDIPFVWDISFVEVFEGERQGFDIVIGNPPYVRQENIRDPRKPAGQATTVSKKIYKNKLQRSVYTVWPKYFGYDWSKGKNRRNPISLRSDLYMFFYFHGLSLLNEKGSFCFVTSNSWLDLSYGTPLQKLLLTRGEVKLIIDNQLFRSFENADINTVIVLLSKPNDSRNKITKSLESKARFVMLRIPNEGALTPIIWEEITETQKRNTLTEYRVHVIRQEDSYRVGIDSEGDFVGDKWGGKYLRAPDIYHEIMDDTQIQLAPLSFYCDVEGYIHDNNTGKKYPEAPFVKSVKDLKKVLLDSSSSIIKDFGVKPTGNSRIKAPILFPRTFGSRHLVVYNPGGVFGKEFYKILPKEGFDPILIAAQLNSTFGILQRELLGAVNLGDGAIKFSAREVKMFQLTNEIQKTDIINKFLVFADREVLDIPLELDHKARKELDKVIFGALGLSNQQQKAVYDAVKTLVMKRMKKASSV